MTQQTSPLTITTDAYTPAQIADCVCKIGIAKVTVPVPTMLALAVISMFLPMGTPSAVGSTVPFW